jgi:hypothetical protein
MINLFKLLWWKKPKPEQNDLRPSERHGYIQELRELREKHAEEIGWMNTDRKFLKYSLDVQIIENAKLRGQIAKKATLKKRNKK